MDFSNAVFFLTIIILCSAFERPDCDIKFIWVTDELDTDVLGLRVSIYKTVIENTEHDRIDVTLVFLLNETEGYTERIQLVRQDEFPLPTFTYYSYYGVPERQPHTGDMISYTILLPHKTYTAVIMYNESRDMEEYHCGNETETANVTSPHLSWTIPETLRWTVPFTTLTPNKRSETTIPPAYKPINSDAVGDIGSVWIVIAVILLISTGVFVLFGIILIFRKNTGDRESRRAKVLNTTYRARKHLSDNETSIRYRHQERLSYFSIEDETTLENSTNSRELVPAHEKLCVHASLILAKRHTPLKPCKSVGYDTSIEERIISTKQSTRLLESHEITVHIENRESVETTHYTNLEHDSTIYLSPRKFSQDSWSSGYHSSSSRSPSAGEIIVPKTLQSWNLNKSVEEQAEPQLNK